ncbi:hypothetical protein CcrSwift_gp187 [Caulobacter phage CcrSwift]|uniref:Uncharacterized protein n=1 Tax=Caulobacter phage CcrSwift TaxID=2927984 RepID=K4JVS2_9CAUD|nr:hypothetical protein D870_gp234 [Caulobacter phage CcrSwift]AFU88505.1 hypothetical protein CcrSwift_gp187 [Caulobacter phage CcrSwift]
MTERFLVKVSQSLVTEIEIAAADEEEAKAIAMTAVRADLGEPQGATYSASILGCWPEGETQEGLLGVRRGLEMRRGWFWSSYRSFRAKSPLGLADRDLYFYIAVADDQIEPDETPYEVLSALTTLPYLEEPRREYGIAARRQGDSLWFGPCRTEKQAATMFHRGHTHLKGSTS